MWSKQKEFLKLSSVCQNKEKINHAVEKLIEICPNPSQLNIIKRVIDYIQEDVNRMIRMNHNAYHSNTSIGSTNHLLGTPGGGMFQNRPSANNTLDYNSNPAMSPS